MTGFDANGHSVNLLKNRSVGWYIGGYTVAYRAKTYMNGVSCKYKTNIKDFNNKYEYEKENE
jgi:hypothetical protein